MPDPLIVFGSGGHAKVVIEAVLTRTPDRQVVVLDDLHAEEARSVFGLKVLGGRGNLDASSRVIPAIGDNLARAELIGWLVDQGHLLETVVHPNALVAHSVSIGPGTFVSAGAIVIAETRIGAGSIINTGATVDHDCVIGEAVHIAPGVHLCGNVHIGARTLVGVGASIKPGISICSDVVIGAGSVVVRDIRDPGTFTGNPARQFR
jgi:sugar O-acyltransferase (sialic acid O-acetyltransferase NeuD family)